MASCLNLLSLLISSLGFSQQYLLGQKTSYLIRGLLCILRIQCHTAIVFCQDNL